MSLRHLFALSVLLACLWTPSVAANECLPAPLGLSAWFRFEDDARDQLGPLTGTVPTGAAFVGGKVVRGISLDGLSGVVLPQDSRFDRSSFSLETWIRRSDINRASLSNPGDGAIFAGASSSYSLTMGAAGQLFLSHVGIQSYNFGSSITDLEWHHVGLVRSGPLYRLFLDGQPAGELTISANIITSGAFAIGSLPEPFGGQFYAFYGDVDEFSFYGRELQSGEFKDLFEAGSLGKCSTGNPGPDCEPPPAGLAAWFPLDEDARNLAYPDKGGGASAATFGPGMVKGAAFFDGLAPGIILQDDPKTQSQDFTVETWIQRASSTATSQSFPPNGAIFAGGVNSYALGIDPNGALYFNQVGVQSYYTDARVTDLAWHHVAMTKSGGAIRMYLDGALGGIVDVGSLQLDLSTPFAIGSLSAPFSGYNYAFWGGVDEFSLYDRPLSAEEIFRIWARGSGGKCRGGLGLRLDAPAEVVVGASFDYNLTVINQGTNSVSGVIVTNAVPAGFQVTSTQPSVGTASVVPGEPGSTVIFSVGDLPAGATAGLRVTLGTSPVGRQSLNALAVYAGNPAPVTASASVLVRPICSPVPGGLVAWWKGDSNAVNWVSGLEGGLSNGVTYVEGRIGGAFHMDGQTGTGVNVGRPAMLQRGEFSIEGWLRRSSLATVSPSSAGGTILGADTDGWNFALLNTGALTFGRSDISAVSSAPVVNDLAWHHVAVTRTATEVRFYRDGEMVSSQAYSDTFKLDQDYGIGGIFPSGRNAFLGDLDEIAFYDRILTAEEVSGIALAGGAPKCVEDLVLRSDSGGPVPLGEDWSVDWVVSNDGSQPSTRVTFTNSVPPGLLLVSATASQGSVENLAGVLRGELGDLPAGSNAVVHVVLRPLVAGAYTLAASVGRSEGELSLVNNRLEIAANAVVLTVGLEGDVTVSEPAVAEFVVSLNAPSVRPVTVSYTTLAGTDEGSATAGVDFEPQSGTLEFPPGTVRQTVRIPVVADGIYELDEHFTVILGVQVVNAALGNATAIGTIVSPDPIPVVQVQSVRQLEGNAGVTPFRFEVSLNRPSGSPSSFQYTTTNDSAKAPTDFVVTQGIVRFAAGETHAVIEVPVNADTAVEPNEAFLINFSVPSGLRFVNTPPLPAVGTIVNDDAVVGLVTGFSWDALPAEVTVGETLAAGLSARDGTGAVVPAFNGVVGVQAFAGPGLPSSVILTELSVLNGRAVELQNVSADPVDVSGWVVHFYDATRWPAPKASFVIPGGTTVNPSQVFIVEVTSAAAGSGAFPRFRVNENLVWSSRTPEQPLIAVAVADATGSIRDTFFAGDVDPAGFGVPTELGEEDWSGPPANALTGVSGFLRPSGQNRNSRRASDWKPVLSFSSGNLGRANPGLVLPFADAVPLGVHPDTVSGFNGGTWAGNLTLNGYAPSVRFLADDGNGHQGLSAPVRVRIVDDLAVTLTAQPLLQTYPTLNSNFEVTATNLGPVPSSNVTARVLLSPLYNNSFAIVGTPTVSQGTVSVANVQSPTGGALQTQVTARFGDLPPGQVARLNFTASRRTGSVPNLPVSVESTVTLTRDPVELNLLNNSASVVQELSTSCAPLGDSAVAWWAAEGSLTDSLAGLAGRVIGGAVVGEGRVGSGGFLFDGLDGAIEIGDSDLLDFGADDLFTFEAWIRVPIGAPRSFALISKVQFSEGIPTGYVIGMEDGFLTATLGDGVSTGHWVLGSVGNSSDLRDGQWHHVAVTSTRSRLLTRTAGWVDGQLQEFQTAGVALGSLANSAPLRLGASVPALGQAFFPGSLDELIVHRRSLNVTEIQTSYRAGGHGHCQSTFELAPVTSPPALSPLFVVSDSGPNSTVWTGLDAGLIGHPYRFDFTLKNRGAAVANAEFKVFPYEGQTNFTVITSRGQVPYDPSTTSAQVPLGNIAANVEIPLAVELIGHLPTTQLDLFAGAPSVQVRAASANVRIGLLADTDGDGIPDDVETGAGLDPASAADAGSDKDGDGFTAAQEYEAGTALNDPNSALRLRIVDGQVVVDAIASRVYRLERRASLDSGEWDLIQATRPEANGVLVLGPIPAADEAGYYRVIASLPY